MASIMKATKKACGNLFNHYERKDGIRFSNQEIDKTRTFLNYNLAPDNNLTQMEILNQRLSEVKVLKRNDVNVTCNWVVTLPKTINKDTKEERLFFQETYNFLKNRYGEKNVVSAYVHKDEVTPHMHFCFIPVVMDKKKNIEKVSAFELITKRELNSFHKDLSNHLNNYFKRDIGILNGATTNGNKTVLELKNEQLEKEINYKKKELDSCKILLNKIKDINSILDEIIKINKEKNLNINEFDNIEDEITELKVNLVKLNLFKFTEKRLMKEEIEKYSNHKNELKHKIFSLEQEEKNLKENLNFKVNETKKTIEINDKVNKELKDKIFNNTKTNSQNNNNQNNKIDYDLEL